MNAITLIKQNVNKDRIRHLMEEAGARHIVDGGDSFRSTCPLHGGDNPTAFTWNYTNGLWFCFTGDCGGGDIFDFVADIHDLSVEHNFKEVVRKTAEILEIDISNVEMGSRADRNKRELEAWLKYASRGTAVINPPYDTSKLGNLFKLREYRGYDSELLDEFSVSYSDTYKRICVKLFNENNVCVGATLRRIDESETIKWLHRPKHVNTSHLLYGLNKIQEHGLCDNVLVTEGVFDVINMKKVLGIDNCVATFGAHLTDEQVELLTSRFVGVILAYDGDKAGQKATLKAIEKLRSKVNLYVLDLRGTPYHDLGEIPDMDSYNSIPFIKWYEYEEREL